MKGRLPWSHGYIENPITSLQQITTAPQKKSPQARGDFPQSLQVIGVGYMDPSRFDNDE
jgi:hypothetical protein